MLKYIKTLLWFLIINYISLIPADEIPKSKLFGIPHFDKMVHFGIYFIFSIFLASMFNKPAINKLKTVIIIIVLNIFIGGTIEYLQDILPVNRSGSYLDFLADILGCLTALLFYYHLKNYQKIDKYL